MLRLTSLVAPALIAALGVGVALPAQARDIRDARHDARSYHQDYRAPARNQDIRTDISSLSRDIDRAVARRAISPREATGLRRELVQLQRNYARLARNGLTRSEARQIESRVQQMRFALRAERRDSDRRRG